MRYIVGNLTLIDVFYEPQRFKYRLHATNRSERLGFEMTGRMLDALPDRRWSALARDHFLAVLERGGPVFTDHTLQATDTRIVHSRVLVLPLSSDGRTVDMLLSGCVWD